MSFELEKYTPPSDVTKLRPLSKFERENADDFPDFYREEFAMREQLGTGRITEVGHECIKPFGDLALQTPANTIWKCEDCGRTYRRTSSKVATQQWAATKSTAVLPKNSNHPKRVAATGGALAVGGITTLVLLTNLLVAAIAVGALGIVAFLVLPVLMLEDW